MSDSPPAQIDRLIDAALSDPAFGAAQRSGAPVIVVGPDLTVLRASPSALALFGAADLEALGARLLASDEPGARRLAELAATLRPAAPPRLERLRFFIAGGAETLTMLCRRAGGDTPLFVTAAMGVRPSLLVRKPLAATPLSLVRPSVAPEPKEEALPASEPPAPEPDQSSAPQTPATAAATAEPEAARQESPAPAEPPAPAATPAAPRTGSVRFVWATDAESRFVKLTDALCETLGCDSSSLLGSDFRALAESDGFDPSGRLRAGLAARGSWSGVDVRWPLASGREIAPVTLGALPTFDRERRFTGFSGFGVINLAGIEALPQAESAQVEPTQVEPTQVEPAQIDAPVAETAESVTPHSITQGDVGAIEAEPQPDAADAPDEFAHLAGPPAEDVRLVDDSADDPQTRPDAEREDADRDAGDASLADVDQAGSDEDSAPVAEAAAEAAVASQPEPHAASKTEAISSDDEHDALDAPERAPQAGTAAFARAAGAFVKTNVVALDAWKNGGADRTETPKPAAATPPAEPPRPEAAAPPAASLAGTPETKAPEPKAPEGKTTETRTPDRKAPEPWTPSALELTRPSREAGVLLSSSERNAFREIARALGATFEDAEARHGLDIAGWSDEPAPATPDFAPPAATTPTFAPVADPAPATQAGPSAAALLLDRVDIGLIAARDGQALFVNRPLLDLLGYADAADFEAFGGIDRMFRGRDPHALTGDAGATIPVVLRNGDVQAFEGRLQAIEWEGQAATLISLRRSRDAELTARIRTLETEVRQKETQARELHAMLDTATDGVAVIDEEGRLLALNRSAEALFGYEQNEVAGEPFTILFARDSQAAAQDYLSGLKSNGVMSVLNDGREVTGRARQGGQMPMFMTLGRIGVGGAPKFCAVLRDLTQWKNAERELKTARQDAERASALKSDFLAKISHEIRTPLNAILGFAEVIIEERFGPVGNERYKDYLKDIHASGTHVMSLVNDLLDLSKIEAGKLDLDFGAVDANRIVNECVSIMQSQALQARVILRVSLAPRLPNVVADERSLRQIVLNILSNAVKFNQPGGQVIVSTALTDAGHAVIRFRDTGIGMNDKEVETALEPFRQIHTSRQTTGTGLGLPLTKALVEANRASFTIRSKRGEGTLVEVAFPPTRVLAE